MYFIFLFLVLFYQKTLALIYNDTCIKKCDFPGMVCINNRCICDTKARLFWTSARCAPCPNDWTMTETACIAYYATEMPWMMAKSTCQNLDAELISFRNRDLISLIYRATDNPAKIKLNAWTSAHATDLSELGEYRWLDKNVKSFDITSDWWCKTTTTDLGYVYLFDEPTRFPSLKDGPEECVVYWQGTTETEFICLDDQNCSRKYPFVCEKSESTANQHLGPAPVINNLVTRTSTIETNIIQTNESSHGTEAIVINTDTTNAMPKAKKKSNGIIKIVAVIIILLLLALLAGLFFFLKHRKITEAQFNTERINEVPRYSIPKIPDNNAKNIIIKDELIKHPTNTTEDDLVLDSSALPANVGINLDTQKQQKKKRPGYSKQQFNEFE